jgi:hypothetical protein
MYYLSITGVGCASSQSSGSPHVFGNLMFREEVPLLGTKVSMYSTNKDSLCPVPDLIAPSLCTSYFQLWFERLCTGLSSGCSRNSRVNGLDSGSPLTGCLRSWHRSGQAVWVLIYTGVMVVTISLSQNSCSTNDGTIIAVYRSGVVGIRPSINIQSV